MLSISLLQLAALLASSQAWTVSQPRQSTFRTSSHLFSATDDHTIPESYDQFPVTTRTNKKLIFDDQAGRFFETSLDPETPYAAASSPSPYEIPKNLPFSSNEMVPTELLFGRKTVEEIQAAMPDLIADLEEGQQSNDFPKIEVPSPPQSTAAAAAAASIVEDCYAAFNQRNMAAAANCFEERFLQYQDSQYLGVMNTKMALQKHFENQAKLLPTNSQVVLKHMAVDESKGTVGTEWYVTDQDGTAVPFTRGCSFYTINPQTGLIQSGFRVSEMIVKPNGQASDALVSLVSRLAPSSVPSKSPQSTTIQSKSSSSILDTFFNAWNRRDMAAALDCFVEDCVFQTEDPVFVTDLKGKDALRTHLEKNAKALPASAQIILDDSAVDEARGTIGATWHLEVDGRSIPNLRGCSMYTIDPATGLLKSGFDVTEAPVKVPRQLLSSPIMSFPARILFGRQ